MGIQPFNSRELEELRKNLAQQTALPPYQMTRLLATVDTLRQSVIKQAMARAAEKYGTHTRWPELIQDDAVRSLVGLSNSNEATNEA